MALIIVLLLIVGGFAAGVAHEQGWGTGVVLLRALVAMAVVAAVLAIWTWWKARRMDRELADVALTE